MSLLKLFLIFIFTYFVSCSNVVKDERKETLETRMSSMKTEHIGKTLYELVEILGDTINFSQNKVILLISSGDCGGCISKGFDIIKTIEDIRYVSCHVISAGLNTAYLQTNYSYKKYIFTDNDDLVRRSISYCQTPVILGLNSKNEIISMLFPKNDTKQNYEVVNFVKSLDTESD